MSMAFESVNGVSGSEDKLKQHTKKVATFMIMEEPERRNRDCKLCMKPHSLWACEYFKKMDTSSRWDIATKYKVCFRCLNSDHFGRDCPQSRMCGLSGCKSYHSRLLHTDQRKPRDHHITKTKTQTEHVMNTQSKTKPEDMIAMRTVPVVLKNGNQTLKVNALLDEASTRTYVNSDVAAKLSLKGVPDELQVNTLNNQQEVLQTTCVKFDLCSLDGNVRKQVSAHTVNKVTGDLQVVDWENHKTHWRHLQEINFPRVGHRTTVDILIGLDHADLMMSGYDVKGDVGEPIARLTPLGWTCVMSPKMAVREQHAQMAF